MKILLKGILHTDIINKMNHPGTDAVTILNLLTLFSHVSRNITPRNTELEAGAQSKSMDSALILNVLGSATLIPRAEDPDPRSFALKNPGPIFFFTGSDLTSHGNIFIKTKNKTTFIRNFCNFVKVT